MVRVAVQVGIVLGVLSYLAACTGCKFLTADAALNNRLDACRDLGGQLTEATVFKDGNGCWQASGTCEMDIAVPPPLEFIPG
jgi:hypothetical protein